MVSQSENIASGLADESTLTTRKLSDQAGPDELITTPESVVLPEQTDVSEKILDSAGDEFDPDVHILKRNGEPAYTRTGRFRKKVVRKSKEPEPEPPSPYLAAAAGTVATIEMAAVTLGGDEFRYIKDKKTGIDERQAGIDAFTQYYEAKGITDFPPGIALAIWAIAYAGPRLAQPQVRERFGWLKRGIKRVKSFIF